MKRLSAILIPTFLLLSNILSQENLVRYDYSSITGSLEWKTLTRSERVEKCNFDQSTLENMSELDLLRALYDYPFLIDLLAFNDSEFGYAALLSECSVLQELLSREDINSAVVDFYSGLSKAYCGIPSNKLNETNFSNINFIILEYIFGRPEFLAKLSEDSKWRLLTQSATRRDNYMKRFLNDGSNSVSGMSININASLICGLSLNIDNIKQNASDSILNGLEISNKKGSIVNKEISLFIDTLTNNLLSNNQ